MKSSAQGNKLGVYETQLRSFLKSVTWRIIATIVNFAMVYAMTGKLATSIIFGIANLILSFFLYWLHERFWVKINFGIKIK